MKPKGCLCYLIGGKLWQHRECQVHAEADPAPEQEPDILPEADREKLLTTLALDEDFRGAMKRLMQ